MSHHHHHHHCPKSTGLTYLLWFFFGVFGVHRFYLQRYVSGFIYLFTLGIFGIGWLVDLFLIPSMVRHFNNHYFSEETVIVAPAPIIYQNQPYQPYQPQPQQYYAYGAPQVQQVQPVQPYQPQPAPYNPPAY
ncbi:TM2 domain-containing protein [Heterostelium album PN500]|uniref:TM2 domain-containing protein n=1 Tax=Heterostelium pallidum (strain ATCC 26659 / Pp 5 / PN500) TaxID=670386 RepID=D3B2N7_HETP5|nr:TM2 domain-containing protein [Heterostelium album PN500]EFA83585.1 TM2 domain-containing protein [Heterostelium album PN500]|eukprot:XP_020435702.1 TM2 domain-containing protein [Heterostelium album PN500]